MPFLDDITIGQYYPADSVIHRLDPRTKILAVFLLMMALTAAHRPVELAVGALLLFGFILISRVPLFLVLRNLRPFLWLLIFTLGFHLFLTTEGKIVGQVPLLGWNVSQDGLYSGLLYSGRLAEFVILAALLTLTTSPIEITDALDRFFSPLKKMGFPAHEVVMMMTLALRFIPTLIAEADKIKKAQISRGASFDGNMVQRIKSVIPLIVPLFISVFRRADELALAMDSRCYVGGKERTCFKELKFTWLDYVVLVGQIGLLILFFAI